MPGIRLLTGLIIGTGCLAVSVPAAAQSQSVPPAGGQELPLCRDAEPGDQCRTRNGSIRVRRAAADTHRENAARPDSFGGDEPTWVREPRPDGFGGDEPTWVEEPRADAFGGDEPTWVRQPRPDGFGGADVGFVTGNPSGNARPEAMECENCDDDEDVPQGPVDNTPRPQSPRDPVPGDDEDDCEWNNPAGGPDQEECDE